MPEGFDFRDATVVFAGCIYQHSDPSRRDRRGKEKHPYCLVATRHATIGYGNPLCAIPGLHVEIENAPRELLTS